jgi:prepilin-type N-terminal cleavage/methylation domain-containing protein
MWRRLRQWTRARLARNSGRPDRQGFSLVEIMMVMVILAVGVLPIAVVQHHARREVGEADRHTQAIAVAQMQVERLKSQGFGNIINENGVSGNITWAAQIANVSFGLDRLTVTATWQNKAAVETLVVSDLISMR